MLGEEAQDDIAEVGYTLQKSRNGSKKLRSRVNPVVLPVGSDASNPI
jgi:hypothetical protein